MGMGHLKAPNNKASKDFVISLGAFAFIWYEMAVRLGQGN
jgi:hypothetical protein